MHIESAALTEKKIPRDKIFPLRTALNSLGLCKRASVGNLALLFSTLNNVINYIKFTYTASRFLPLALRALRIARPERVFILMRNPCVRLRRVTEG